MRRTEIVLKGLMKYLKNVKYIKKSGSIKKLIKLI